MINDPNVASETMSPKRGLAIAKSLVIAGFVVLLSTSYYLRSEAIELNRIRFSSDEARAARELVRLKESQPERLAHYQMELKNHELREAHYQEMLALYKSDYDAYVKRLKDEYRPPQAPAKPQPPDPPEYQEELMRINTDFRMQKYHYFKTAGLINATAWAAATALIGGLVYLLMFDVGNGRAFYVVLLVLSFVFLIGPSFHTILSAIIGFLEAPRPM